MKSQNDTIKNNADEQELDIRGYHAYLTTNSGEYRLIINLDKNSFRLWTPDWDLINGKTSDLVYREEFYKLFAPGVLNWIKFCADRVKYDIALTDMQGKIVLE